MTGELTSLDLKVTPRLAYLLDQISRSFFDRYHMSPRERAATLDELRGLTDADLLREPNLGKKALEELRWALKRPTQKTPHLVALEKRNERAREIGAKVKKLYQQEIAMDSNPTPWPE